MKLKRGDLVFVFDPARPTGSGTGFRGLALVDELTETEVKIRPLDKTHQYVRIANAAVRTVYAASFVAEEFLT